MTDRTHHEADAPTPTTTLDPATLRERDDVPVVETERVAPPEAFDGVRANYDHCEGVVVVGVVEDGRLLLVDDGAPGPVRGDVQRGEDWAAAARRVLDELAGVTVAVEAPVQVEFTTFRHADGDEQFTVPTVDVRASLVDAPAFREDPEPLADPAHKYHDDGTDLAIRWYDDVPGDVHPNHEDHVRLYLD